MHEVVALGGRIGVHDRGDFIDHFLVAADEFVLNFLFALVGNFLQRLCRQRSRSLLLLVARLGFFLARLGRKGWVLGFLVERLRPRR